MGILDDIKNMKPVSNKVFTVNDLIKIFNKIPYKNKGNKMKPVSDKVVTIEYLREGYKKVVEAIYNKEKDNK